MKQESLELWEKIFDYVSRIVELDPWSEIQEKDILVLQPKGKREQHFFSFLLPSCGQLGIAVYRDAGAYFRAQRRLHEPNPKKEPAFYLQDAIIFLLGDREDVSKENYVLLKELNISCRGRGHWPYFQQFREGYQPRPVPEEELETLLDDVGNLWAMVRAVVEEVVEVDFENRDLLFRGYSEEDDMFYTFAVEQPSRPRNRYPVIGIEENERLRCIRELQPRGTLCLDWSYIPMKVRSNNEKIIPRLLLAADSRSGAILRSKMLMPSDEPWMDLVNMLEEFMCDYGKPAAIEICDEEIECYLSEFCKKTKIRLVVKKQIKQMSNARRELLDSMQ